MKNKPIRERLGLELYGNTLLLGPTGCGKTRHILKPMIEEDLRNKDLGIILLDPKGDLSEEIVELAKSKGRKVHYFNPALKDCPYFNPLQGNEDDVIKNLVTTLKSFNIDSKGYFQDSNENLIRRAIKVIKRLYKNDATLVKLDTLINNVGGEGMKMINEFSKLRVNNIREKDENDAIVSWFAGEYFESTSKGNSKSFEASSGARNQIHKIVSNKLLNKILNPPSEKESLEHLDFDKILADGDVCVICSTQGKLRDLDRFLNYFLIFQIQSAVFRILGNENTRRGCMLYIDEFQTYANSGMVDILIQGRAYRVGCVMAVQNTSLIDIFNDENGDKIRFVINATIHNVVFFPKTKERDTHLFLKNVISSDDKNKEEKINSFLLHPDKNKEKILVVRRLYDKVDIVNIFKK